MEETREVRRKADREGEMRVTETYVTENNITAI